MKNKQVHALGIALVLILSITHCSGMGILRSGAEAVAKEEGVQLAVKALDDHVVSPVYDWALEQIMRPANSKLRRDPYFFARKKQWLAGKWYHATEHNQCLVNAPSLGCALVAISSGGLGLYNIASYLITKNNLYSHAAITAFSILNLYIGLRLMSYYYRQTIPIHEDTTNMEPINIEPIGHMEPSNASSSYEDQYSANDSDHASSSNDDNANQNQAARINHDELINALESDTTRPIVALETHNSLAIQHQNPIVIHNFVRNIRQETKFPLFTKNAVELIQNPDIIDYLVERAWWAACSSKDSCAIIYIENFDQLMGSGNNNEAINETVNLLSSYIEDQTKSLFDNFLKLARKKSRGKNKNLIPLDTTKTVLPVPTIIFIAGITNPCNIHRLFKANKQFELVLEPDNSNISSYRISPGSLLSSGTINDYVATFFFAQPIIDADSIIRAHKKMKKNAASRTIASNFSLDNITGSYPSEVDHLVGDIKYSINNTKKPPLHLRGKGVLFLGPAGNGKTELLKAIDGSLTKFGTPCLKTKISDLAEAGLNAANLLRTYFENAENEAIGRDGKGAAILFIDEFDKLLEIDKKIADDLLSILDGQVENYQHVILIVAANMVDQEGALMRTGRFNEEIFIDLPPQNARIIMLKYHLQEAVNEIINSQRTQAQKDELLQQINAIYTNNDSINYLAEACQEHPSSDLSLMIQKAIDQAYRKPLTEQTLLECLNESKQRKKSAQDRIINKRTAQGDCYR